MMDTVDVWNERLENAARGSIAEYQETLVRAIEGLGNANGLSASGNDISWAMFVIAQKRKPKAQPRPGIQNLRERVHDAVFGLEPVTDKDVLREYEERLHELESAMHLLLCVSSGNRSIEGVTVAEIHNMLNYFECVSNR